MPLYDSPLPYLEDLWLIAFSSRPALPAGSNGVSRFSRMEFPCMPGVSDSAGPRIARAFATTRCCLPCRLTPSAPRTNLVLAAFQPPASTPNAATPPATVPDNGANPDHSLLPNGQRRNRGTYVAPRPEGAPAAAARPPAPRAPPPPGPAPGAPPPRRGRREPQPPRPVPQASLSSRAAPHGRT